MLMIVYADIYILINFACNLLSFAVCVALNCSRVGCRIFLSAFIMSLYSFFMLFADIYPLLHMMLDCCVLIAGMVMAFGKTSYAVLVRNICVFFASSVVTGGIAGMLAGVTVGRAVIILFVTPLVYFAWYVSVRKMRHAKKLVSVTIDGKSLSGLSDSGNILYDNRRGLCVIVVKSESLDVNEEKLAGWIKTETVCGTGYMPYYYPERVEIENRRVNAAVALTDSREIGYDCIVPDELT
ncbi:MAG: sigma-E processing peptidase SpoIIGA [Clostridia bacterium]|nr:sigma-E processing peptidase SpoIIGA [Clostridia bacterium]